MRISRFFMAVSASLMMFAACTPAPTPAEKTNEAIKAVMEEFQNVGISAAVVKDGKIVYNESFGYKNLETKEPLGNTDVMRIASISKSFTATALMQLVDKGVISLFQDKEPSSSGCSNHFENGPFAHCKYQGQGGLLYIGPPESCSLRRL